MPSGKVAEMVYMSSGRKSKRYSPVSSVVISRTVPVRLPSMRTVTPATPGSPSPMMPSLSMSSNTLPPSAPTGATARVRASSSPVAKETSRSTVRLCTLPSDIP